jgi:hypothetical protein
MNRSQGTTVLFWSSIAAALLLALMPLPVALEPVRPFWLALVVIYWSLEEPERMSLGRAFALGIVYDLLSMSLLGESALRLAVLDFILLRFRPRLRFFPMPQQSLAVLALAAERPRAADHDARVQRAGRALPRTAARAARRHAAVALDVPAARRTQAAAAAARA